MVGVLPVGSGCWRSGGRVIRLQLREPFTENWTDAEFDGSAEAIAAAIVASSLSRNGWEVLMSRDDEDFIPVEEVTEEENDDAS